MGLLLHLARASPAPPPCKDRQSSKLFRLQNAQLLEQIRTESYEEDTTKKIYLRKEAVRDVVHWAFSSEGNDSKLAVL